MCGAMVLVNFSYEPLSLLALNPKNKNKAHTDKHAGKTFERNLREREKVNKLAALFLLTINVISVFFNPQSSLAAAFWSHWLLIFDNFD